MICANGSAPDTAIYGLPAICHGYGIQRLEKFQKRQCSETKVVAVHKYSHLGLVPLHRPGIQRMTHLMVEGMQLPLAASKVLCHHRLHSTPVFAPHRRVSPALHLARRYERQSKNKSRAPCAMAQSGASTKVLKETAALDQLIDLFLTAKSQQQVTHCLPIELIALYSLFVPKLHYQSFSLGVSGPRYAPLNWSYHTSP